MDKETAKSIGYLTAGTGVLLTSFAVLKDSTILSGVGGGWLKWISIAELSITLLCLTILTVIALINRVDALQYNFDQKINALNKKLSKITTNTGPEVLSLIAAILMYFIEDLILPDDTPKLEKVVLCTIYGILLAYSSHLISTQKKIIKAIGILIYIFPIPFSLFIYKVNIFNTVTDLTQKQFWLVMAEIIALIILFVLAIIRKREAN